MPADKIKEFLNEHDVQYSIVHHEETYTAQETAKLTRIRGKKLAKTIIIRLDWYYEYGRTFRNTSH